MVVSETIKVCRFFSYKFSISLVTIFFIIFILNVDIYSLGVNALLVPTF